MSGSAFPALLQLACTRLSSINTLVGARSMTAKWFQELILISVLPGPCSRYLQAQMRKLSGFWSKSCGGFFLHSSEVFGNTSEVGFSLVWWWPVDDNWGTSPGLLESTGNVCVLTFLNSNLPCKVASCLLDSVYLHRQCVIRVTVNAPLQNFWGGRTKTGDWGCCEYLFTVNLKLTSVIKAKSSSSLLQTDDYLALSLLA